MRTPCSAVVDIGAVLVPVASLATTRRTEAIPAGRSRLPFTPAAPATHLGNAWLTTWALTFQWPQLKWCAFTDLHGPYDRYDTAVARAVVFTRAGPSLLGARAPAPATLDTHGIREYMNRKPLQL